ncbi:MAG TPA: hypothetical protein VIA82_01515 [Candidatus Limnocylindria bacterium]|jgi:hypothetical protein
MAQEGTGNSNGSALRGVPRWQVAVLALGVGVLVLSLVPGWLMHSRVVGGEGYRTLTLALNAWQLKSVPVLSLAAVAAGVAGMAAPVPFARRWMAVLAALALGLLLAGLVPLSHAAHVTSVAVTPGWALFVALAAVGAMVIVALRRSPPPRTVLAAALGTLLVAGLGGGIGRFVQLQEAEAVSSHWSPGTYQREGGTATLTLTETTYASGSWSGALQTAGTSIILTADPACPDARGFYHVRSAGGEAILVEKVIDICADGDRTTALEGTWTPAGGTGGGGGS